MCGKSCVICRAATTQCSRLRILIVGASGLIGSALAARLIDEGQDIVGTTRRPAEPGLSPIEWLRIDVLPLRERRQGFSLRSYSLIQLPVSL